MFKHVLCHWLILSHQVLPLLAPKPSKHGILVTPGFQPHGTPGVPSVVMEMANKFGGYNCPTPQILSTVQHIIWDWDGFPEVAVGLGGYGPGSLVSPCAATAPAAPGKGWGKMA